MSKGTNGINPTVLNRWTEEILRHDERLEEQKIDNMNICRDIRQDRSNAFESAFNAGLPKKAFKAHVEALRKEKAIERLQAKIEELVPEDEDDAYAYEQMRKIATKGDLFDHTVQQHDEKVTRLPRKPKASKADVDTQAANANAEALKAGIKPLDDDEFERAKPVGGEATGTYDLN